jgi:hypothetical protein
MNINATCPKCGSDTLKNVGWIWMLAAIWLVAAVVEVLIAALVPAAGPVWSYKTAYGVVMNLFFAGFFASIWKTFGPQWRCMKCKHAWR